MRTGMISSVPPSGGEGVSSRFRIAWQSGSDRWHINNPGDVPMSVVRAAITDLLNRDQGKSFLAFSVAKASGLSITPERLDRNLKVSLIQEGADSGIFRVDARVKRVADRGPKTFSFCLNAARNPSLSDLHTEIFENLTRLRKADPKYVVEPYAFGRAVARHEEGNIELAVISTEWLDGFAEVNMFNAAESVDGGPPLEGIEAVGLRRVRFNQPGTKFQEGIIRDGELANSIASEMVKILTLYFDPQNERAINNYQINSGDFVYREKPGGGFDLKLVSCRDIVQFPPSPSSKHHIRAFVFLDELFNHREVSVHYQGWEKYAIYTFTPSDVCEGIKKALVEKFGAERARPMILNWLGAYLALILESHRMGILPQTHEELLRQHQVLSGIECFLRVEGYPGGRIVIES